MCAKTPAFRWKAWRLETGASRGGDNVSDREGSTPRAKQTGQLWSSRLSRWFPGSVACGWANINRIGRSARASA